MQTFQRAGIIMLVIIELLLKICEVASGIAVAVVLLLKFGGNWLANYLQARYQAAFDRELEKYKNKLEGRQYVTKKRYDKEFEIYEKLSACFYYSLKTVQLLIPEDGKIIYPVDPEERKKFIKDGYDRLCIDYEHAMDTYYCYVAFIIEDAEYEKMLDLIKDQKVRFHQVLKDHTTDSLTEKDYGKSKELQEMFQRTNCKVRTYLRSLEVA